jgi:hypothetical protein
VGVLPNLVEFELRGIPAHAWETSTTAQILNPFAWIHAVHPDSLRPVSHDVFRCTAWAADQATIPAVKDLWVVEPPAVADEDPPGKRTFIYPIRISFTVLQPLSGLLLRREMMTMIVQTSTPRGADGGSPGRAPTSFLQKAGVGAPQNLLPAMTAFGGGRCLSGWELSLPPAVAS